MAWPQSLPLVARLVVLLASLAGVVGCASTDYGLDTDSPPEVAKQAFNVYDADARARAVMALSNAKFGGERPYVESYRMLVTDTNPMVRAAALQAIGRHGESEDVSLILPNLTYKENKFVRWEAVVALQRLHREDAAEALTKVVRDEEEADLRAAGANALGQYARPAVVGSLIGALNDSDYAVAVQARRSLVVLTGQDFGDDGAAWLEWTNSTPVERMFEGQRVYVYPQYNWPRNWFQKLMGLPRTPPTPKSPKGYTPPTAIPPTAAAGQPQ